MPEEINLDDLSPEQLQELMFKRNIVMSDTATENLPTQTQALCSIAASLNYFAVEREEQRHKGSTQDAHRSGLRRDAFDRVKDNPPPKIPNNE